MMERTTPATQVRVIAEMLRANGLNIDTLFEQAGLDISKLDNPYARYPSEKVSALWECAVAHSGNQAIGVAGPFVKPPGFDMHACAVMSSSNLLGALERLAHYLHITDDACVILLHKESDACWVTMEIFGGDPAPRQRIEFALLLFIAFCHWIAGHDIHPLAVNLAYRGSKPEPQRGVSCQP